MLYIHQVLLYEDLEKIMAATSEIQIPGYNDISTLKIVKEKTPQGEKYVIKGDIQKGWDYDNNKPHMAFMSMQWDTETPLQQIMFQQPFVINGTQVKGLRGYLDYARDQLQKSGEYQSGNRSYDPSFISDEWYEKMTTQIQQDAPFTSFANETRSARAARLAKEKRGFREGRFGTDRR